MKIQVACLGVALGLSWASSSLAVPSSLQAHLRCEPAAGPGRILCELTTTAALGKLVWSDALVVRAPSFARALRSRVVAQVGGTAGAGVSSAKLALVAVEAGRGQLELLARAVVCHEGPAGDWCAPEVIVVAALVSVAPRVTPGSASP